MGPQPPQGIFECTSEKAEKKQAYDYYIIACQKE
jgi:hypothetical protein